MVCSWSKQIAQNQSPNLSHKTVVYLYSWTTGCVEKCNSAHHAKYTDIFVQTLTQKIHSDQSVANCRETLDCGPNAANHWLLFLSLR